MSLPISVIIPTRNRPVVLAKTLQTFFDQTTKVEEIIIIDGSEQDDTKKMVQELKNSWRGILVYERAEIMGAAAQRNQGVRKSSFPYILFADDDVYLQPVCIERLWSAIQSRPDVGGVSAMITNQKYLPMGRVSSTVAFLLLGKKLPSYAGKLLTPGWGMLPEDGDHLPPTCEVEWLNLGATLYRKDALPNPPFQSYFKGYSMMEDITLSAIVGKEWKLLNARTARIYHDSQPGDHKKNQTSLARMEVYNRHYVMTNVMKKKGLTSYLRFFLFEVFGVVSNLQSQTAFRKLPAVLAGKMLGIYDILTK